MQKKCNENAKLREALEDAKVALAMHPVAGMDAALQQKTTKH